MRRHMHHGRLLVATTAVVLAAAPASASAFAAVDFGGGPAETAPAVQTAPLVVKSNGFVWDDALIGAGVGAVAVGLGAAGAAGVGRSRRRTGHAGLLS